MSAVDPRFVCRREGHTFAITFTNITATVDGASIAQLCTRCGVWVDVPIEVRQVAPDRAPRLFLDLLGRLKRPPRRP